MVVPPARPKRFTRLAPWAVLAATLLVAVHAMNPFPLGVVFDDAVYAELGKAIAMGAGLHYLQFPGAPAATHFPPGYPLFLALLWLAAPSFPANVLLFKVGNAVFVALSAVGIFSLARRRFGYGAWPAALCATLLCIGVPTLLLSDVVMSEPMFLAAALLALLVAERAASPDAGLATAAAAGGMSAIVALIRTQGVALLAALLLVQLFRRRYRHAAVSFVAAAVLLAPWSWWVQAHAGTLPAPVRGTYGPYLSWYLGAMHAGGAEFLLHVVAGTLRRSATSIATLLAVGPWFAAGATALVIAVPLAVLGAWRARSAVPVTLLFLALYLCITIAWPYPPDRFLFAVWPLLAALPLLGFEALWHGRTAVRLSGAVRWGLLAAAALPALGYAVYNVRGYRDRWWEAIPAQRGAEVRSVIRAVQRDVPPGAVVCALDDAAIYLYTGHPAVPFQDLQATGFLHLPTVDHGVQNLRAVVTAYAPERVIVTSPGQLAVARRLATQHPPVLAVIDSFPSGYIYAPIRK